MRGLINKGMNRNLLNVWFPKLKPSMLGESGVPEEEIMRKSKETTMAQLLSKLSDLKEKKPKLPPL